MTLTAVFLGFIIAAAIGLTGVGGGTITPAATLTTANGTTDNSSMPPDAMTQWQGLAAAVELLNG